MRVSLLKAAPLQQHQPQLEPLPQKSTLSTSTSHGKPTSRLPFRCLALSFVAFLILMDCWWTDRVWSMNVSQSFSLSVFQSVSRHLASGWIRHSRAVSLLLSLPFLNKHR